MIKEEISFYFRMVLGRGVAGRERGCYETSFTVMNKCGLFSAVPLLNNTTRMEFEEEQINVAFN